jgi:hypothetical protein
VQQTIAPFQDGTADVHRQLDGRPQPVRKSLTIHRNRSTIIVIFSCSALLTGNRCRVTASSELFKALLPQITSHHYGGKCHEVFVS